MFLVLSSFETLKNFIENAELKRQSISKEAIVTNIHIRVILPKSAGDKNFVYKARTTKLVSALIN